MRYEFGSEEEIVAALLRGYKEGSDILRVYESFAQSVANSPKVAAGVNLAWEFACYDVASLPGATPMLSMLMGLVFPQAMAGLFENNPEFLAEVLKVRTEILNS